MQDGVLRDARERPAGPASGQSVLEDFRRVYEEQIDPLQAAVIEWARSDPEFGPLLAGATDERVLHAKQQFRTLLCEIQTGAWGVLLSDLREKGALGLAGHVSVEAWYRLARIVRVHLLPPLVDAYQSEPSRLIAIVQEMQDVLDRNLVELIHASLASKEAQLGVREQDLATTFDSIGDAVIVTDVNGCVVRMNPVAERLTGFLFGYAAGKPLDQIFHIENEDTGESVESPIRRVLTEGVVVGLANHTALVAQDGSRCPIADSGAPVRDKDGKVRGVVIVFRDVTEQRLAEEALRRWELVFQHACWGICLGSAADVRFAAVNPAYAAMHGYSVEELLGAPISIVWPPETRRAMDKHTDHARAQGQLVAETIHVRKDGTKFPAEVVASTIKDGRGKPVWFVANVQDITERKRLQEDRARSIELEAENRRVEEANRLKTEFLANMSHELRTPLNSIIGFADLIYEEQVGTLELKQKEFLGDILSSGRHLLRLINDVLDLAKIEAGKMDFSHERVDLAVLVQTVIQSLSTIASDKNLRVEQAVDPSLSDIVLDPGRFTQILYNYLSNALKFTPEGGAVAVRILPEGEDQFRLEVEDTGPGISESDMNRLFVAFQQLDSGAAKRHGGTGLGLALTKQLTEVQGGSAGAHSVLGQGSIFFAVLPRWPLPEGELRGHAADQRTVLVIEEDPHDRQVLVNILKTAGYGVVAVATYAEAMTEWETHPYDAITLDLLASEGRELQELLKKTRSDVRGATVPVLAVTVVSEHSAATGFPVADVLTKPVSPDALLAALDRAGVPATRGRPVMVVDDDAGSLKLMDATLAQLGYESICFADASSALLSARKRPPVAVVVDLIMPEIDGFTFIERFRAVPDHRLIPVMVWTVKDLTAGERLRLRSKVQAVVEKGVGAGSPLSVALKTFLPPRTGPREYE